MSGEGGAIAEVLASHEYALGMRRGSICRCGFIPTVQPETLQAQQDYHREHVAEVLADLLAAERQRGREEALREAADRVRSRREAFLDSPSLDRAWIAGWHAATDDHAAALADVPAAAEGERE